MAGSENRIRKCAELIILPASLKDMETERPTDSQPATSHGKENNQHSILFSFNTATFLALNFALIIRTLSPALHCVTFHTLCCTATNQQARQTFLSARCVTHQNQVTSDSVCLSPDMTDNENGNQLCHQLSRVYFTLSAALPRAILVLHLYIY